MQMLLTSRGFSDPLLSEKILEEVRLRPEDTRLLYIATAVYGYSRKNKLIEGLEARGFQKEKICFFDHRYPERVPEALPDLIYVCGGNTFLLLDLMRKSGFLPRLQQMILQGVPYVGASAGTHLVTKSIAHLSYFDENKVGLSCFDGLGLFPGIAVCHYGPARAEITEQLKREGRFPVYPIDNETLLIAAGETLEQLTIRRSRIRPATEND